MALFRFIRALTDLFWSFFPVFIVVLVLAILGKLSHIAERSDLILCAALLFAEGWWRIRKVLFRLSTIVLEFVGFIGALVAVFLASTLLLVEAGKITELAPIIASERFMTAHLLTLVLSVIYGLIVRLNVLEMEDQERAYYRQHHDSQQKSKSGSDL